MQKQDVLQIITVYRETASWDIPRREGGGGGEFLPKISLNIDIIYYMPWFTSKVLGNFRVNILLEIHTECAENIGGLEALKV